MMHVLHQDVMQEMMRVKRLTVTIEDTSERQLAEAYRMLPAWRDAVREAVELARSDEDRVLLEHLVRLLDDLGDGPSSSEVMRRALDYFFTSIEKAQRLAKLEAGYRALARDPGREVGYALTLEAAREVAGEP